MHSVGRLGMDLQPTDALVVIAELAVALAGFAGLVVTLRNRGLASWPQTDRVRLQFMLIIACSTFFVALVPFLASSFEVQDAWTLLCLIFGLGSVVLSIFLVISTWPIRHQMVRAWWLIYLFGTFSSTILLLASTFQMSGVSPVSAYLIALLWMLFFSTTLFVRLILAPTGSSTDEIADNA